MSAKRFRLWIDRQGAPLYVEVLGGSLPGPESLQQIAATIEDGFAANKPIILGPEWELSVVAG